MGNYATEAQLEARYGSSTEVAYLTDTEDTGVPDQAVLTDCIESAEGSINIRLAARYATPINVSTDTSLASAMKRMTLDVAEWFLDLRGPTPAKEKGEQAAAAWDLCDKVGRGIHDLPGATTIAATVTRSPMAGWSDSSRTLDADRGRIVSRETSSSL